MNSLQAQKTPHEIRRKKKTALENTDLISTALWVHKHKQWLHELGGNWLHYKVLPFSILAEGLRTKAYATCSS